MEPGIAQIPPVVFECHRLIGGQQLHDDLDPIGEELAGLNLVEADHDGVSWQRAGADAEHEASPSQVVKQDGPLGHPKRIMVADTHDTGTELDVPGTLRSDGNKDLGRSNDLGAGRMVLADPGLVPSETVEMLDQIEIALQGERGVVTRRMERRHEDSEAKSLRHAASPLLMKPAQRDCRPW